MFDRLAEEYGGKGGTLKPIQSSTFEDLRSCIHENSFLKIHGSLLKIAHLTIANRFTDY
jgi:hypothetical protein